MLQKGAWVATLLGTLLGVQDYKKVKFPGRDNSPLAVKTDEGHCNSPSFVCFYSQVNLRFHYKTSTQAIMVTPNNLSNDP